MANMGRKLMTCPFIEGRTKHGETKCRYEKEIDEIKWSKKVVCIGGCFDGDYTKCDVYKKYV